MNKHQELANRLRVWYEGGKRGMQTVCETEGAPEAVKQAAHRWYEKGQARLDAIIKEIEELGDV